MSGFAPENVTSASAETDSSIGEAASVMQPHSTRLPLLRLVEKEAVTKVVREYLEARGESNEEVHMINVVGGGGVGARNGAETDGFTFVDALS